MLDFNRILLLIACLSPVVVLVRTWQRAALNRGWRLAALVVLVLTVLTWIAVPRVAGYAGGSAWLLLLFAPAVGLRHALELAEQERWRAARRLVALLYPLHPTRALRDERTFLSAMELAQNGAADSALHSLANIAQSDSRAGVQAAAQSMRLRGAWEELLAFCRAQVPSVALGRDPALLPLYLRALGETGRVEELVVQVAGRAPALLASPSHRLTFDLSLMLMFAFTGRTASLKQVFRTRLREVSADAQQFWIATSEAAEGQIAGRVKLEKLRAETPDSLIRIDVAQRLKATRASGELTAGNAATVARFERHPDLQRGNLLGGRSGPTPVVLTLIALNAAMFLIEMTLGGATNSRTLHRLGALEPAAVWTGGEYWRLLTALFLHFGSLHLLFNSYALYVLGPGLERSLGKLRFAFTYLVAGLGSSAGVVLLWRLRWTEADFLVGASGSVMGIVGAWAGLLLRQHAQPGARPRLARIAVIVVMQTAFDLYTPQVSMAAHLCGLLTGLVIGFLLAPNEEPRREFSEPRPTTMSS